jgi:hypothetical protein
MATSGSYNFTQNLQQLILDAFQLAGIYGINRSIDANDLNFATNIINKMVKAWAAQGLHLWAKEEAMLFVTQYQSRYMLSNDTSAAKWANIDDTNVFQTTTSQVVGNSQVVLNSVTGLSIGSNIGIVLDSGATLWTTVSSIASLTVALATPLTSTVAQYNQVYTYTTRAYKPSRIYSCRRLQGIDLGVSSTQSEVWLKEMAYQSYMNLSAKSSNGVPSAYMYNPDNTSGEFYLWQRPITTNMRIQFTYERLIQDLDTVGDTFDFPSEWLEPLTYQLAWRLCTPYGKDERAASLLQVASVMLENLKDWDAEIVSLQIKPHMGWLNK